MQIDKDMILNLLRQRGDTQQADQAAQELPNSVDTDRDAGLLERFGLNPQDLMQQFGGGMNLPGV